MTRIIWLIAILSFAAQATPYTGCIDVFLQIGDCPALIELEWEEAGYPTPTKPPN